MQKAANRCNQPQGTQQNKHKRFAPAYARSPTNKNFCTRCGKSPKQPRQQCPANEAICHHCSKKGHFKYMCRSKTVIGDVSDEEELIFLDTEIATVNGAPNHGL